jgi:uncharacterized phage protein (predicted DNA packaging)
MADTIEPKDVLNELNLDETDEELKIITDLINQAEDYIRSSVNYQVAVEEYLKLPMFKRAVTTLVAQLYYDRTLENGLSKGMQMMINHLRGRLDGNTAKD